MLDVNSLPSSKSLEGALTQLHSTFRFKPQEFKKSLKDFNKKDRVFVGEFLRNEDFAKPYYDNFAEYSILFPSQSYSHTLIFPQKAHKRFEDLISNGRDLVSRNRLDELNKLNNLQKSLVRVESDFMESLLSHGYFFCCDNNEHPVDVMDDAELRNEILRRVFPKMEDFQRHHLYHLFAREFAANTVFDYQRERISNGNWLSNKLFSLIEPIAPNSGIIRDYFEEEFSYIMRYSHKLYR